MCWTFQKLMAKLAMHHVAACMTYVSLPLFSFTEIINGVEFSSAVTAPARGGRPNSDGFGLARRGESHPRSQAQIKLGAHHRSERLLGPVFAPLRCGHAHRVHHQVDDRSGGPRRQTALGRAD